MMSWGWHHGMGYGMGYGMGVGMWLVGLLLVAVIAAVVFLVVRATTGDGARAQSGPVATAGPNPRELLALRYARGEISTAEYEERLTHLAP